MSASNNNNNNNNMDNDKDTDKETDYYYYNSSTLLSSNDEFNEKRMNLASPLSLITDLAEEIYENEKKLTKTHIGEYTKLLASNNTNLLTSRSQIVPVDKTVENNDTNNVELESDQKENRINEIRNDLGKMSNIAQQVARVKSGKSEKHQTSSSVNREVCEICGPDVCHICTDINHRRKLTDQIIKGTRSAKSRSTNKSALKRPKGSASSNSSALLNPVSAVITSSAVRYESPYPRDSRLLAIIMKDKLGLQYTEDEIDDMIKTNKIFMGNRVSPYNLSNRTTTTMSTIPTKSSISTIKFYEDDIEMHDNLVANKDLAEPPHIKSSLDVTVDGLKKFNVTDFYFRNVRDLQAKAYFRKDKVLLSETPVPKSSNKLFSHVEVFDISDKYKIQDKQFAIRNKERKLIDSKNFYKPNKTQQQLQRDNFEKMKFVSSRNFRVVEPKFIKFYEPPLLQLKMQKFDDIYDKIDTTKHLNILKKRVKYY